MKRISRNVQRNQQESNIKQDNGVFNKNQFQITASPFSKTENSELFFSKDKNDGMINDTIELTHVEVETKIYNLRKELPWQFLLVLIVIEISFTCYQALVFTRKNGVYEFVIMEFIFSIICILISFYLVKNTKRVVSMYFMLDPLMTIALCFIATYIFPYVVMKRVNIPQILEQIGFFMCNICIVGNFRMILVHMKWTKKKVLLYKLSKLLEILFYLIFGAVYTISGISYSQNTDSDADSKVQDLVILFVFSGFALQLEVFNRVSDFDGTSELKANYLIPKQQETEQISNRSQIHDKILVENQNMNQHQKQNLSNLKIAKIKIIQNKKISSFNNDKESSILQ